MRSAIEVAERGGPQQTPWFQAATDGGFHRFVVNVDPTPRLLGNSHSDSGLGLSIATAKGRSGDRVASSMEDAMRLSEAIRLGAMMTAQEFGAFVKDDAACALGAALLAVREPDLGLDRWSWAFDLSDNCPCCGRYGDVIEIIMELNDDHRWPRDQIGQWVAMVEPKDTGDSPDQREREHQWPRAHF